MTQRVPVEWFEPAEGPLLSGGDRPAMTALNRVVDQALRNARVAAAVWRDVPTTGRLRIIRTFRESLAVSSSEIAGDLCGSNRTPAEFLASEILPVLDACRFLEKCAPALLRPRTIRRWTAPLWLAGVRHEIIREPFGVVLVIGPSNYPFFLPAVQALQGIVAGNAVLLKPGQAGTGPAALLQRLLSSAGLPDKILQLLPETPRAAAEAINSGVDKVFLTGSRETGRKVLASAAQALTPAVVELSGCDGAFVLPDANLDLAAECIAFALTLNSGRTCIAPRRVIVWRDVADVFERKIVAALERRPLPFISGAGGKALVDSVCEAVEQGARVVHGMIAEGGIVDGPLILADVPESATLASGENWGPILSIIVVRDAAHAIRAFDRSPFGLGASIFSASTRRARHLASRLNAGSICINDLIVPTADGRLPFGGRKQSGFGFTRGPEGLLEMTTSKVVSHRSGGYHFHLRPAASEQLYLLSGLAELSYGGAKGLRRTVRRILASIQTSRPS